MSNVGLWRVTLKWADEDGRKAVNVLHFRESGAGTLAADVVDALKTGPGPAALGPASGHSAVTEIQAVEMADDTNGAAITTGLTLWDGGGGTGDYSIGLSAIVRLHTAAAGRSGKGRIFLPFLTESAVTKGRLIGDALTATAPAWEAWTAALIESEPGLTHEVWSETHDVGHAVQSYSMNPIPGFRRKRANEA